MPCRSGLPLLAFQHHLGCLYIGPEEIDFVSELGVGDLAIVEQGRWHRADGTIGSIVVKGYKPFVISSPADFRELLLEASQLHKLRHPNITQFFGLGCFSHGTLAEVRESMFMVEEYVGTRTLRKLIGEQMRCRVKNLYNMQTALRWAAEAASALAALHEQHTPYIHGDIKSDNVFLTDDEDLDLAVAKLGDLKPHRHVYEREPSTLSQHQDFAAAKQARQSSLARYALERSSSGGSCSSWPAGGSSGSSIASPYRSNLQHSVTAGKLQAVQKHHQQAQSFELMHKTGSKGTKMHDAEPSDKAAVAKACTAGEDSVSSVSATDGRVQRTCSMPVPITIPSSRQSGAGRRANNWSSSNDCRSLGSAGEVHGNGLAASVVLSHSLPSQCQLRTCSHDAAVAGGDVSLAGDDHASASAGVSRAAVEAGQDRRRKRPVALSDSASSTTSASSSSARVKPSVELVSLATAGDDDDDLASEVQQRLLHDDSGDSSSGQSSGGSSPTALQEQQRSKSCSLQEAFDCSARGGSAGGALLRTAKSMPSALQQKSAAVASTTDEQVHDHKVQLQSTRSAPADVHAAALKDSKVHQGQLMMQLSASLAEKCAVAEQRYHQKRQSSTAILAHKPTAATTDQQRQQHQQAAVAHPVEAAVCWELSPSGAASPCGVVHSAMLDLFADMAEEEVYITRRDQYTISPGSFVQQRAQHSLPKPSQSWEPVFNSSSTGHSHASQPTTLENKGSLKGGAPAAIESKQHGSNSAFAALTAIDSIKEETSSIATDSVMGSYPPSRDTSAHSGVHYYSCKDDGSAVYADKDESLSGSAHAGLLSKSVGRALGFSSLLPIRSISINSSSSFTDAIPAAAADMTDDEQTNWTAADHSLHSSKSIVARPAMLEGSNHGCDAEAPQMLITHMSPSSRTSSGDDAKMAIECNSPTAASVAAAAADCTEVDAAGCSKRVRFTVERAAGTTPSRDYSLLYAAPELLSGQRPTEKVDVFAFGVVLYELLSRSLLMSHCAAAVGHNRSRRGSGSRHGGSRHGPLNPSVHGVSSSSGSDKALSEPQLLLEYAQMVAAGYRPPFPEHFPAVVRELISSCWAAEPHQRPRMADVLGQLQAWSQDKHIIACLDSYLAGLTDVGYAPHVPKSGCGCVIS